MLNYQLQNSTQTLSDGIAEYHAAYADQLRTRKLTPAAESFFRCHDVAHVVFGCDISLSDELVVKMSSMFGTSAGISVLQGYRLAESKQVYQALSVREILVTTAKALLLVPTTLIRCIRMRKRWHWDDFDCHLNRPLGLIREEFGVVVPDRR